MIIRSEKLLGAIALVLLLGLGGCGGGGSDGDESSATVGVVALAPTSGGDAGWTVSGTASKSPLLLADVLFFEVGPFGFPLSSPIASTTTDDEGNFSVTLPGGATGPILVETSGGTFLDESDQEPDLSLKRRITLNPGEGFLSILPAGANTVALTPYTHSVVMRARMQASATGDDFEDTLADASSDLQARLGFDVFSTMPANPIAPAGGSSLAEMQYAMLLGAVANVINNAAIQLGYPVPIWEVIYATIEDLSDGLLDGKNGDFTVEVYGDDTIRPFPNNIDFGVEQNRFRNNNFANYEDTPLLQVFAPIGQPPVANAGPDQTVAGGSLVTLNGSASSDADGTISSYSWSIVSDVGISLNNPNSASPTFTALSSVLIPSDVTFKLKVTDNSGNTSEDTVDINIGPVFVSPVFALDVGTIPHKDGVDVDGGAQLFFGLDGSGNITGDMGQFPFAWTETSGVVRIDFSGIGGYVQDANVYFNGSVNIAETERIDFFEVSLLESTGTTHDLMLREVGLRTFIDLDEASPIPDENFDDTNMIWAVNDGGQLPFGEISGLRTLPTRSQITNPTLPEDTLYADRMFFISDGTGSTSYLDESFTWSVDATKRLNLNFSNGDVAQYFNFSEGPDFQRIGVVYQSDGDRWADAGISLSGAGGNGDPGIYTLRGSYDLEDGTVVEQDIRFWLNPNRTGYLEMDFVDDESGDTNPYLEPFGLCWADGDGDELDIEGILTSFPMTTSDCLAAVADTTVGRWFHRVVQDDGVNYAAIVEEFKNTCDYDELGLGPCLTIERRDFRNVLLQRMPLPSNAPYIFPDSPLVYDGDDNVVTSPSYRLSSVVDPDGDALDDTSVKIVAGPYFGSATIDPVTGVIEYFPDVGVAHDQIYYRIMDVTGAWSTVGQLDITVD